MGSAVAAQRIRKTQEDSKGRLLRVARTTAPDDAPPPPGRRSKEDTVGPGRGGPGGIGREAFVRRGHIARDLRRPPGFERFERPGRGNGAAAVGARYLPGKGSARPRGDVPTDTLLERDTVPWHRARLLPGSIRALHARSGVGTRELDKKAKLKSVCPYGGLEAAVH